jgi:hypothetical protein
VRLNNETRKTVFQTRASDVIFNESMSYIVQLLSYLDFSFELENDQSIDLLFELFGIETGKVDESFLGKTNKLNFSSEIIEKKVKQRLWLPLFDNERFFFYLYIYNELIRKLYWRT